MVNEVLCKILAHSISCVIQEQEELGIPPMFWKDEDEGKPQSDVLPRVKLGRPTTPASPVGRWVAIMPVGLLCFKTGRPKTWQEILRCPSANKKRPTPGS